MKLSRHLAAALLLAGPGIALAQNVAFQDIGRGAHGAFGAPRNIVARTQQEFTAAGLDQLINPAALIAPIDWQNEMVVATLMGTQSSGGHGITIESITRQQLMVILPVPGPPPAYELVVRYRERRPGPGEIVTLALTSPYHVVRLRKHSDMVRFELAPNPPAGVFERGWLSYDSGPIGSTGEGVMVEVDKSGAASASRFSPTAFYAPVSGQATAAELQALESAIQNARASSLPQNIDPGVVFIVAPPSFQLVVFSNRPQLNGNTSGVLGHYGSYEARVRPLVAAYKAIGDRLLAGTQGQEFTGRIELPPGGGVRLIGSGINYRISPQDKASELAQFRGRTVRVRGALQSSGPDMQIQVSAILSPEHRPLDGVILRVGNGYALHLGSPFQTAPLQRVRTFGDPTRAFRLAEGNQVHCDAWVFTNADGTIREARIDSIEGTMKRRSAVFDNGQFVGIAQKDEGIHVLGLSGGSGDFMRIKSQAGIGWVPSRRVEVGSALVPVPGPVPLTTAGAPSTGLINAIPGN